MRYEQLSLALSTAACDMLEVWLSASLASVKTPSDSQPCLELLNLRNELVARLQRTDLDPHCPRNFNEDLTT